MILIFGLLLHSSTGGSHVAACSRAETIGSRVHRLTVKASNFGPLSSEGLAIVETRRTEQ
jgi:hypothetical protein